MVWNYRVMVQVLKDGTLSYGIHEVYYDDLGRVKSWTIEPMEPNGKTVIELRKDHKGMREAFYAPVLSFHDGKVIKKGVPDVKIEVKDRSSRGRNARQVGRGKRR